MKRILSWKGLLVLGAAALIAAAAALFISPPRNTGADGQAEKGGRMWTCSMHPQVRLSAPGKCPICSMPLIPTKPVSAGTAGTPAHGTNETLLELSDHALAMASVETAPVRRRRLSQEVRVVGTVQYNETGLANITTRVGGYVERLFVDYTGIEVKKGDHLVEIYSPDLLVAQQELLVALEAGRDSGLIKSARRKLLLWGLTPEQVDDLILRGELTDRITLFSPIRGTVTERLVSQNGMVRPGETLYRLVNLDSVWVYLEVFESDLPWVRYGQMVEATAEALPGMMFSGRVWFISPVLDDASRTVKVLLNIDNSGRMLKPGMYVSAVIRAELLSDGLPAATGVEGQWSCTMHPLVLQAAGGECTVCGMILTRIPGGVPDKDRLARELPLCVPVSSVLDTGVRKLVYVERSRGRFAPVEIETGPRAGGFYPVRSGLAEGDRVATRGSFLLDSQAQILGLPSLFNVEGQAVTSGHRHGVGGPTSPTPGSGKPQMDATEHEH